MKLAGMPVYSLKLAAMVAKLLLCPDLNLESMEDATYELCDAAYRLLTEVTGCELPASVPELQEIAALAD